MSEPIEPTYDPRTLREVYPDLDAVRERVAALRTQIRTAPDDIAELLARGELVELLLGLDDLDAALAEAGRAADRAEMAGTPPQQHLARMRLAHAHQRRGEFAESNLLFTELLNASGQFGPIVEAFTLDHAGRNEYAQGHYADAREHFAKALATREQYELPEAVATRLAVEATDARLREEQA
jgi:tetratricopeptide (TPR) repeat protein